MINSHSLIVGLLLSIGSAFGQSVHIKHLVILPQSVTEDTETTLLPVHGKVTLSDKRNSFLIYFSTTQPVKQFAYRLNGVLLHEITTRNRFAFFNHLPAGEYTFTVRAVDKPTWPMTELKLTVEAPIWLRWWFLPLMFLYGTLLIGLGFYFLYRYRMRQLMHLQAVREHIARDLHDDIGSYLSSISILSQGVINLFETDPHRAQALVQKIGATARQVMDSMGEIIWSVNPVNDSMRQIITHMRDLGSDLLEEQDIVFSLDADEAVLNTYLPLEKRREFFLIYKEALTNIAKYAKASHVQVQLARSNETLSLIIRDDGVGFDPQKIAFLHTTGGNGIKNMHERAVKLGGNLILSSALGHGTAIQLKL